MADRNSIQQSPFGPILGRALIISAYAQLETAPTKTERFGNHYELTIGIGNDHTANLIIDEEALLALQNGEPVNITTAADLAGKGSPR